MPRDTCIHFTGWPVVDDHPYWPPECRAGVNYRQTFGQQPAPLLRLPCVTETKRYEHQAGKLVAVWVPMDRRGREELPCSKRALPTEEDLANEEAENAAAVARVVRAIPIAEAWRARPRPPADRSEIIECPLCKGDLSMYQSAANGHVHMRCATPGCVRMIE